jgi:multiple sugar transport system ATP-binding protein
VASLELKGVSKSFGGTPILDAIDLTIEAREFIAFLGPSGSGKSTLLRIIAGLERADSGEVWLEGRRIDQLPPGERGVAMVFQHYALYPHMSVRENMAFGLRNARVANEEIERRINDAAGVLEIEPLLDRKPAEMSGGQRQRVAIGRALVKEPKLFLLDEPLSNLDAALRLRTRVELAQLKQRVDAAVIMVTHDQAEAMTLADRIIVMNDRRIQQVGPPMEIYNKPANTFVAQFVGSPAMTLVPAKLAEGGGEFAAVEIGDGTIIETKVSRKALQDGGDDLRIGLRPEAVRVGGRGKGVTKGTVDLVERLGERTLIYARLGNGQAVTAEDEGDSKVKIGDEVPLKIEGAASHLFDASGSSYHVASA